MAERQSITIDGVGEVSVPEGFWSMSEQQQGAVVDDIVNRFQTGQPISVGESIEQQRQPAVPAMPRAAAAGGVDQPPPGPPAAAPTAPAAAAIPEPAPVPPVPPSPADIPASEADFAVQAVERGPRTITPEQLSDAELLAVAERAEADPRTWGGPAVPVPQPAPEDIVRRGGMLPLGRTAEGGWTGAWPEMALGPINTIRDLADGTRTVSEISGEEIANLGAMVAGGRIASRATAPAVTKMAEAATEATSIGIYAARETARQHWKNLYPVLPDTEALRASAQAAYKVVDDAGAHIKPDRYGELVGNVIATVEARGYDPLLQTKATVILKRLQEALEQPMSVTRLDNLRKLAGGIARGNDPDEARVAKTIIGRIDKFLDGLKLNDLVSARNIPKVVHSLKTARFYDRQRRKSEIVDKMLDDALTNAPNFSGSGLENALRTEFRALSRNAKRLKPFTAKEKKAIKAVARGGIPGNFLRMVGKAAPTGIVSTALSTGAGAVVGGPIGAVALPTAGFAARQLATAATKRRVGKVEKLVRGAQPDEEF